MASAVCTRGNVFIINSSQSQMTLSGEIESYTFTPQGSGSLTANYQGTVNATFTKSNIQFTGSSDIAAITNGSWQPGTNGVVGVSQPADYGGEVNFFFSTAYGALRHFVVDLTSPVLPLTQQTNFVSTNLVVTIVTNSNPEFDFDGTQVGDGNGYFYLSGETTNNAATASSSFSTNNGLAKLVIQINTTLASTNGYSLTIIGTIVATNPLAAFVPPQITRLVNTNHNFVITVSNAFPQSLLFSSTNLTTWSQASATVTTNNGYVIYTLPAAAAKTFFRVQKGEP
jgi:hypothetical protein